MPVADFAGRFGWGYDGVDLYAPTRLYGTPDDLRAFVDRAHALGLGVILDVVYNHLGPGRELPVGLLARLLHGPLHERLGRGHQLRRRRAPARAFFVENAGYWIDEFHFDGLRLDATQDIHDASPRTRRRRIDPRGAREAPARRAIYVVAENEPQETRLVRDPAQGGYGVDALWNDDYHHTAVVALTGRREAYYFDYKGSRAGVHVLREVRLSLSGPVVPLAEEAPRNAGARPPAARVRHATSRITIRSRTTPFGRRLHQLSLAGASARADRADAARSGDADAFPGAGVRLVCTVPVFRGPQGRAARAGVGGTAGVPVAVSERARPGRASCTSATGGRRDLQALQAELRGAADEPALRTTCTAI